jgi:hypothetical protein
MNHNDMMKMYFHFDTTQIILFKCWDVESETGMSILINNSTFIHRNDNLMHMHSTNGTNIRRIKMVYHKASITNTTPHRSRVSLDEWHTKQRDSVSTQSTSLNNGEQAALAASPPAHDNDDVIVHVVGHSRSPMTMTRAGRYARLGQLCSCLGEISGCGDVIHFTESCITNSHGVQCNRYCMVYSCSCRTC